MKKKNLTILMALTLTIGIGVTAFAAGTGNVEGSGKGAFGGLGLGRIINMRGMDINTDVLKEKLGLTDKEIEDSLNSGKTYYDLAKEKGMTEDEFKEATLAKRTAAVDEAIKNGTITKEAGEDIKERINDNSQNCDGTCNSTKGQGKQMKGRYNARGRN